MSSMQDQQHVQNARKGAVRTAVALVIVALGIFTAFIVMSVTR